MTSIPAQSPRSSRGLRHNLPWLLAALLGAATIHAVMRVIHDTSRRRIAARLVAQATAEQIVSQGIRRLEAAGARALAPVPAGVHDGGNAASVVGDLVQRHRDDSACGCAALLPAAGYFRFTENDRKLALGMLSDSGEQQPAPGMPSVREPAPGDRLRAALVALARSALDSAGAADLRGPGTRGRSVRLHFDSALGDMIAVVSPERDRSGRPVAVTGLIAERRALLRHLFDAPERSSTLARLDEASIEVRDPAGDRVYGAADSSRRFRGSITDRPVLGGASVIVALERQHIASPLIAPIASAQVWHLTAVLLATIVAIILGVRSSRREAQLASARSDFVASVSHELRMPLAQILLASETLTLQRERDPGQRLALASSILREARRLVTLVENVLLVSRTGAIELRPRLEAVDVEDLFADVGEAVQLAVDDAGQTLETSGAPRLAVRGDRTLLRQALVNLLDNAMKYGRPGQCLRLSARAVGGSVQLAVEDEGRGVPHADRSRVFDPWERLSRDQHSERTGTGLGLAVVRQVAVACGGRVWLEERPGGGARAVIELPAAAATVATEVAAP